MRRLLDGVAGGVIFMFSVTLLSLVVIIAELGLGLWSVWFLSVVVAFLWGRQSEIRDERRRYRGPDTNQYRESIRRKW